jgi:hypothetical protein
MNSMVYLVIIFILLFFLAASISVNLWLVKTLQDINDESELEWGFEEELE